MKFLKLVAFFIVFFSVPALNAQSISCRIDLGGSLEFSSLRSRVLPSRFGYFDKPLQTGMYQIAHPPALGGMHVGLLAEVYLKNGLHIETGVYLGEAVVAIVSATTPVIIGEIVYNGQTYSAISKSSVAVSVDRGITKFPLHFSYDFKVKNWDNCFLMISPMVGVNYLIADNYRDYSLGPVGSVTREWYDGIYADTTFTHRWLSYVGEKKSSASVVIGTHFRLYNQKRELGSLKLFWEQGFTYFSIFKYEMYRNNQHYREYVYSRGSGLHLKLSIPLRLYQFE